MTPIEQAAKAAYEAWWKSAIAITGCNPGDQVAWIDLPTWQRESWIAAIDAAIRKGETP